MSLARASGTHFVHIALLKSSISECKNWLEAQKFTLECGFSSTEEWPVEEAGGQAAATAAAAAAAAAGKYLHDQHPST